MTETRASLKKHELHNRRFDESLPPLTPMFLKQMDRELVKAFFDVLANPAGRQNRAYVDAILASE